MEIMSDEQSRVLLQWAFQGKAKNDPSGGSEGRLRSAPGSKEDLIYDSQSSEAL